MTLAAEDLAAMPPMIQSAIQGGSYDVTLKAKVVPELVVGGAGQIGTMGLPTNAAADLLGREAAQTGASE
jgi:hypothetical protein